MDINIYTIQQGCKITRHNKYYVLIGPSRPSDTADTSDTSANIEILFKIS